MAGSSLQTIGKLDPTITFTRFEAMIKAGSKDATSSYEGLLDAVRKLVLGPQVKDTAIPLIRGGASGPEFAENIAALRDNATFKALEGKIVFTARQVSGFGQTKH